MIEIELLQVALGNRDSLSRMLSAEEWQKCYDFAERQAVEGVIIAGLERLIGSDSQIRTSLPKLLLLQWIGKVEMMKNKTGKALMQAQRLNDEFGKAGFRTCLLKGVGNGSFYGEMVRTAGDIDLWVMPSGEGHIEKARRLTQRYVHSLYPEAEGEFVHMDWPWNEEPMVEIHFTPTMDANPWVDRRMQRFFEERAEGCFENRTEQDIAVPTRVVNGVFLMHHAKRHFINEGIGLRHIVDYALLLRTLSEDEKKEVWRLMGQFGLQRFSAAVMYVITEVLREKISPEMKAAGWRTDKKRGEYLLREMIDGGNFGHHYEREVRWKSALNRWTWFMEVALNRMRYFPEDAFWSFAFRLRLGINNVID